MRNRKDLSRRDVLALGASGALAAASGGVFGYHILNRRPQRNVVFVISDSLRADRLGCYGYRRTIGGEVRSITPEIDELASQGVTFERCIAPSSWTLPSTAAYMSSRLPFVEGGRYNEGFVGPGCSTVTELLALEGYDTIALVCNPYLYLKSGKGTRDLVAVRGFGRLMTGSMRLVDNPAYERGIGHERVFAGFTPAADAVSRAIGTLAQFGARSRPFFFYLHLMDTHEPYNPPDRFKEALCTTPPVEGMPDYLLHQAIRAAAAKRGSERLIEEEMPYLARMSDLYDASASYVDQSVGKLIHFLKANGLWDETLFIFASDHGEEFGEHGWIGHSTTLYEESLRVPLVMAGRGVDRGRRVQMPVGLLDVAPTILASCGLDVPETMFGSPLDLTGEKRAAPRRLFSALTLPDGPIDLTRKKFALRDPRGMKLVETSFLGQLDGQPTKPELYDLRSDPGETANLADGNPQSVAILSGEVERLGKLTASRENEAYTVSESTMKVLESLGYLR